MNDTGTYDQNNDVYLSNDVSANESARPAVLTDSISTLVLYVGVDFNIYVIDLDPNNFLAETQLTATARRTCC